MTTSPDQRIEPARPPVGAVARPVEQRRRIRELDRPSLGWTLALTVVVAFAAVVAILLHRNGHNLGDDFALYLRQARSIFDGDTAQVVSDNRFAVVNTGGPFSPNAYPWIFPLLLSPFVKWWGFDYDRLKLVEVACFCAWIVLVHGIVARRAGRVLAIAVAAVLATAPALLAHTDQLLSEFPHAMAVGVFLWWFDRIKLRRDLISSATAPLVMLGVLGAVAYNVRRESVVLMAAIGVVQLAELSRAWRFGSPPGLRRASPRASEQGATVRPASLRSGSAPGEGAPWMTLATPHLAMIGSIVVFQLLLPSMLIPDSGDGPGFIPARIGDYAGVLTRQLGIGHHPAIGALLLLLALVGIVVGCVRRPALDIPLAAVALLSVATVSTHFRMVDRYYFQVLPWVLYFAAQAIIAVVQLSPDIDLRHAAPAVAAVPLAFVVAVHAMVLPGDIGDARDFDRAGLQQVGPTDPAMIPIYEAVAKYTEPDAVIEYFRARTMTLLTDRRAIQTTSLELVERHADYYAQQRFSDYSQPAATEPELIAAGFVEVWSNDRWILWRLPDHPPTQAELAARAGS